MERVMAIDDRTAIELAWTLDQILAGVPVQSMRCEPDWPEPLWAALARVEAARRVPMTFPTQGTVGPPTEEDIARFLYPVWRERER